MHHASVYHCSLTSHVLHSRGATFARCGTVQVLGGDLELDFLGLRTFVHVQESEGVACDGCQDGLRQDTVANRINDA